MRMSVFKRCGLALVLLALCPAVAAQQPELVIQTGESWQVYSIAFGPDGKSIVSGGTHARLWDVETGRDMGALSVPYMAYSVAGSARAGLVAVGAHGGEIKIFDGKTHQERLRLDTRTEAVSALAFDAEGRRLFGAVLHTPEGTGVFKTSVKVWDAQTGRELKTLATFAGVTFSLSVNGSGRRVAVLRVVERGEKETATAVVWDAETGTELRSLVVDEDVDDDETAYMVAFAPVGELLAVSGVGAVTLLNVADGSRRTVGNGDHFYAVAFSPDGKLLAAGGLFRHVSLWDVTSGRKLWTGEGHDDHILRLVFSPDGRALASSDSDRVIKVWEVSSGRALRTLSRHARFVQDCFFNPEGKTITSKSDEGDELTIWDFATGRKTATVGDSYVSLFSDDYRWLAHYDNGTYFRTRGEKHLRLWDMVNGREVYNLSSPYLPTYAESWALRPDGRFFAMGKTDGTVLLVNVESRKELLLGAPATAPDQPPPEVAFSPDGKHLAVQRLKTVRLYQTETGREQQTLRGPAHQHIRFSPDGRQLASFGDASPAVIVWDVDSGALQFTLRTSGADGVKNLIFTRHAGLLVTHTAPATFDVWDVRTGKLLHTLKGEDKYVRTFGVSPDNTKLVVIDEAPSVYLWDLTTGALMHRFKTAARADASFLGDGRLLWSLNEDYTIRLWDVGADRAETFGEASLSAVHVSNKGVMAVGGVDATKLYELRSMKPLRTLAVHGDKIMPRQFSPDGKRLITCGEKSFRLWDVASGAALWDFPAALAPTFTDFDFSADGKFVLSGGEDGYLRIWDAATGALLASLVELGEADWAVVTPDGRFDASPGAFELMHWRIGGEVIAFSQLKERFYEPGLLAKVTGHSTEPLRDIASLKHVRLYPEVIYAVDARDGYKLRITLANRGGGIGPVQVFVNGKEVVADARDEKLRRNPQTPRATLTVDLRQGSFMPGQANSIRVYAWNFDEQTRREYISSRGAEVVWVPPGAAEKYEPTFYALVVGVSDYAGPPLRLKYAAKDAEDMARALTLAGRRLFGPDRVHVKLLSTTQTQPSARPTKENIRLAFEEFRKSKPGDVLFIYFAGHGVTLGRGSDSYLFLTQEARSNDSAALADEGVRRQTSVSGEELAAWINAVPALREAMALDTCAAGAFGDRYQLKRTLSGDAIRAIEKLKDRTGFYILMGSAADASAYETSRYGQGLLTYSILQGMRGAALAPGGEVDVQTIFQYAADQVPLLARDIGGIQKPEIKIPRGGVSFPVGLLSDEDRRGIPLTGARPMILRPVLTDDDEDFDRLKLSRRLGDGLREAGLAASATNAFIYVDAADIPDGFTPYGKYAVTGDSLRVTVKLIRNDAPVATFTVEGRADDLPALTQKLIEAIASRTRQLIN